MGTDKNRLVTTKNHTLYSKKSLKKRERYNYRLRRYDSIANYEKYYFNKLFFWKEPKFRIKESGYTQYFLYVGAFHSTNKELHELFFTLKNASSHDTIELILNSSGGSISEGLQFYNFMLKHFYKRTISYLDNHGYSMGAMLFCMAEKRVIYPYSEFMLHNYSSFFVGKGGDIVAKVEHSEQHIKHFFKDIIVKQNFLTEEEFNQMVIGQDFWMDSEELCRRGIATHVIFEGEEITAKEYLEEILKID